ncbi:ferredoxin-type protein NapF [Pasteurellaceae bacterium Macca]|nr:ferredoxin-type protein NapF [Pasteurellaceae bacterium Macca]
MGEKNERYWQAYFDHHHISRRGLLRSLLGGSGRKSTTQEDKALQRIAFRPPFATLEPLFLRDCTACGDCLSACPYGLIVLEDQKATLNIDFSACDLCGLCADACQTGALSRQVKPDTGLRPQFDLACPRYDQQDCDFCTEACPSQAIHFDERANRFELTQGDCSGCGECKVRCPQHYIQLTLA